jgi:hypothetical protein
MRSFRKEMDGGLLARMNGRVSMHEVRRRTASPDSPDFDRHCQGCGEDGAMTIVSGCRLRSDMQHRHRCYTESSPAMIRAAVPTMDEPGDMTFAALVLFPELAAWTSLSSWRAQPVICVSSLGQVTRLKFALYNIRPSCGCLALGGKSTLVYQRSETNRTAIGSHLEEPREDCCSRPLN